MSASRMLCTCTWTLSSLLLLATVAAAQSAVSRYPKMEPLAHYMMERNAEIALARTAAPEAISSHATVMVLGSHGWETAVQGSNGFVCMVERSWISAIDFPEMWNAKIHGPDCLNPQAASSILPLEEKHTQMVLAGTPRAQIAAALKASYAHHQLPALVPGAMGFMMSKQAYLTDDGSHNMPHLMIYTNLASDAAWGAGLTNSPVDAALLWFPNDETNLLAKGLPMIRVFVVSLRKWSDGSPVVPAR